MTDPVPPALRYAVIGDTHIAPDSDLESGALRAVFAWLDALEPPVDVVLHVGDVVECGFEEQFEAYDALIPPSLRMRIVHVPGNHETRWDQHANLLFLGKYGEPPVSFDTGGIHFAGLDLTTTLQELGQFGRERLAWLADDLARAGPDTPIVLFFHFPVGNPFYFVTDQDAFFEAIAPYNVVAIHAGHVHDEQVMVINGVTVATGWSMKDAPSCHLVDRVGDVLRLQGVVVENGIATLTPLATIPLARNVPGALPLGIEVAVTPDGDLSVSTPAAAGSAGSRVRARMWPNHIYGAPDLTGDGWIDLAPVGGGTLAGRIPACRVMPGRDRVEVVVESPGGERLHRAVPVDVPSADHPVLWEHAVGRGSVQGGLVLHAGIVVVTTTGGEIAGIEARIEGPSERWRVRDDYPHAGIVGMPAVDSDGFVYVGSRSGRVLAISASNGVVRWDTSLPGPMIASLHVSEVEDDRLVFVPSGGRIHALDPCHGAARWVAVGEGFLGGRPVADGQAVYASFGDGTLRAFDRDTGRERWSRSVVERQRRYSRLLYSAWAHRTLLLPGLVLTSTVEVATAHDRETGEVAWSLPGRFMYTAGALVHQGQGVVLADERGRVVLVEAGTGHVRWEARPGFPILDAAPVTCDGRVYVPGAGAQLAMLDLDTGEETARVQLGGTALVSTPVIVGNLLVAGGQDGRIRALLR